MDLVFLGVPCNNKDTQTHGCSGVLNKMVVFPQFLVRNSGGTGGTGLGKFGNSNMFVGANGQIT